MASNKLIYNILELIPESPVNGICCIDGEIICQSYQQGLHVCDFLGAMGFDFHPEQLPMKQSCKIVEGKIETKATKKTTTKTITKVKNETSKNIELSEDVSELLEGLTLEDDISNNGEE